MQLTLRVQPTEMIMSSWLDLTATGASFVTNREKDPFFTKSFAERASQAGVEVRLDVFPEMLHSFQMMAGRAPEAEDAIRRFAESVRPKLGLQGERTRVAQ